MIRLPNCTTCMYEGSEKCETCTLWKCLFENDPNKIAKKDNRGAGVISFKPMWFHDICEESLYISSKLQLKDECKRHDVIAARLL